MLALAIFFVGACEPTCKQVCRRVLSCDLQVSRTELDECEASCVFQERMYDQADDGDRRSRLADHKRCLRRSSCSEIREGECYDEELFVF